jgi:sugar-specific transcriptional regulator TrmB
LSQETIKRALRSFGLTEKEAEIYIFLAKHGVLKGGEISKQTKTQKALVYRILKSLQTKGLVESTLESPARFIAVSFEKVIDMNIQAKQEEAAHIAAQKKNLLNYWQNIKKIEPESRLEKFTVIEGNRKIYFKLSQMMSETRNQLSTVTTVQGFMRANQFGFFDAGFNHPSKSKIKFRLLTELSSENISTMKRILKMLKDAKFNFEVRTPELELNLLPQMAIRDQEEALFFITPRVDVLTTKQDDVCLWTNCKSLVDAFSAVFEDMWRNSTDVHKNIEIQTGKTETRNFVINDAEIAEKKYNGVAKSAKEEILIVTSSRGLLEYWKSKSLLEKWSENRVSVKIMAPIVRQNFEVAEQLSKFCSVRHVPINYLPTTIIDGQKLFQFKGSQDQEKSEPTKRFDNVLYSADQEYVKTMKTALNDIWKKSQAPSPVTLESIIGPQGPAVFPLPMNDWLNKIKGNVTLIDVKPPGAITEKDVLNRIINAKRIIAENPAKDVSRMYASMGVAVIHPPDCFNLPHMRIQAVHVDKQSSFGPGEWIAFFLWLETPKGHAYVPVAVVGEPLNARELMMRLLEGSPAGKNIQRVKKDEIEVRIHGNILFAGWTVPIQLSDQYTLPPSCMLIEGYGDAKTRAYTLLAASGFRVSIETNYFDAFVTFIHPSSKYSGPGTDGAFYRDHIVTNYPPSN